MTQKQAFVEIYEQSVIEALLMLGPHISNVIMVYIYEKYSIHLIETYDNPHALTEALTSILGAGTNIIQRRILRLLYKKMKIEPNFAIIVNFEDKILKAKQDYTKRINEMNKI